MSPLDICWSETYKCNKFYKIVSNSTDLKLKHFTANKNAYNAGNALKAQ